MGNHSAHMHSCSPSSPPSAGVISTDSEYDGASSHTEADLRFKPCNDAKVADRRKRNGESAKRSRQKRKLHLQEMENNMQELMTGHTELLSENKKLRELIVSLGGDLSSIPTSHVEPQLNKPPTSMSKTAKRVKRECRVDLAANSLESAVGAHTIPASPSNHCTTLDFALDDQLNHTIQTGCSTSALDLSRINSTELFQMCEEFSTMDKSTESTSINLSDTEISLDNIPSNPEIDFDLVGFVFDC